MILGSIEVNCFRNLGGRITWGDNLNVLYGDNGQGKTNWLEAIYLLAHTKSFRTQKLQEAIKFGDGFACVSGSVRAGDIVRDLSVSVNETSKQILVNGRREPLSRYLGQLHAVAFTADELEVVRGGPESRRRFLDRGAMSLRPAYSQTLSNYRRVVKQKNRLLQDAFERGLTIVELQELIAPWNEQLVTLAAVIHRERVDYVGQLNASLDHNLFNDRMSIRYLSSLEGKGDLRDYESLITDRLSLRLPAEQNAGTSLIGPHRDDLEILFEGRDLRVFGSSGQQRSALIALDLAAISVYNLKHRDYPVFLIDDIDAELDGNRIVRLFEYLDHRVQTFITTSKREYFKGSARSTNFYEISSGSATDCESSASFAATGSIV
jgi:DNA replication and repair protein RecF